MKPSTLDAPAEQHRRTEKSPVSMPTNADLTPGKVVAMMREGYEIWYTPHLGNLGRDDQQVALLGIPHMLVGRNGIGIDHADEPHFLKKDGVKHEVVRHAEGDEGGQHGVLTPFASFDGRDAHVAAEWSAYGTTPGQLHLATRRAAYPEATQELEDEVIFLRDDISARVAEALANAAATADVFDREIAGGRLRKLETPRRDRGAMDEFLASVRTMKRNVETGGTTPADGAVPSNTATFAALAAYGILRQRERGIMTNGHGDLYTVSGPYMQGYMPRFTNRFADDWAALRATIPELPERLTVHMIPGDALAFTPMPEERELADLVREIMTLERRAMELAKALADKATPNRDAVLTEKKAVTAAQDVAIKKFHLRRAELLPFVSQYDALASGQRLQEPDLLRDLTFRRIRKIFQEGK